MSNQFDKLFAEYDELVSDISNSTHIFFRGNLKRWLNFLDSSAQFARPILQQLEASANFPVWYEPYRIAMMGMGNASVEWPDKRRERLGTELLLFRQFANDGIDPLVFALTILGTGRNGNDGVRGIINQMFIPMARELRRYLRNETVVSSGGDTFVPASDRIVELDHNSSVYADSMAALGKLEDAVVQSNDYADTDDKEQRIAELSASRRLLQSARVRVVAISALLLPLLSWLIKEFTGGLIGQLAEATWGIVKLLLGLG